MTYDTFCKAFQTSPIHYATHVAARQDSTQLLCVLILTHWHPVCFHESWIHFLLKNVTFFQIPVAACSRRLAYFVSGSYNSSICFQVPTIFKILVKYQYHQPSSVLIASFWEETQFLLNSLLPSSIIQLVLSLFPL